MKAKAFENVKDQIGACGIWCSSCVAGNGALKELTKKYDEIITRYDLEDWAPKDFDFKEFKKGLESIQGMPLCPGCLKGGGRPDCEIRECVSKKKINDCTECNQPEECKIELLQTMRTGALDAGLFVKMEKADNQKLLEKWLAQIKSKWPSSVLFLTDK